MSKFNTLNVETTISDSEYLRDGWVKVSKLDSQDVITEIIEVITKIKEEPQFRMKN